MELTQAEKKRAEKLQKILTKLQNGEHVQNKMLKTWLTEDEFAAIEYEWDNQKILREELKDKPDEIVEYEKRLRKALFAYNKADHHSSQKNRKAAKKGFGNADTLFERLLEYLEEIIDADPTLCEWFDRELDFSFGGTLSIDPIGIPRVITSHSLDCQSIHPRKTSKNQVKQDVVSNAINQIHKQVLVDTKAFKDKLKKLRENW